MVLGFGPLPADVTAGANRTLTVWLPDDNIYHVYFEQPSYTAAEGGAWARVTVVLSEAWKPWRNETVTVPLYTGELRGGALTDDFSGVPGSVTFAPGRTRASFTVAATDDNENDDGESVVLGFSYAFPDDLEAGRGPASTTVRLADNDGLREVLVRSGAAVYATAEGGDDATVRVHLSAAPGRSVTVPLTVAETAASGSDYSGVPASLTFGANETGKSFTVAATDDTENDDLESIRLSFGTLPESVLSGEPSTATVNLDDNDGSQRMIEVYFDANNGVLRTVREGGSHYMGVTLTEKPGKQVTIPLAATRRGGATAADYELEPATVTFKAGQRKANVRVSAVDDTEDDGGEGFRVDFGTLPKGIVAQEEWGAYPTFDIIDNDGPPRVSVEDDSVREWPNPQSYLSFRLTLDREFDGEVKVDYATVDGTAKAGEGLRGGKRDADLRQMGDRDDRMGAGDPRRGGRGDRGDDAPAVQCPRS